MLIVEGWTPAHKHTQLLLATKTPDFLLHKGNCTQTQKSGTCHAWNGCTPVQTRSLQKSSRNVPHAGGGCPSCWGDSMPNCFRAGCFQQQRSHSVPKHPLVLQTGRGSDATSSTRPFPLATQHPIQAQSGKALGLKFIEH